MNRRKFLQTTGLAVAGAVLAPKTLLAKAVEKPGPIALTLEYAPSFAPPYWFSRMYLVLRHLFGDAWFTTIDYKNYSTTWHVPAWTSDLHYDWLRSWCNNFRCMGDRWLWQRGDEPVRDTHPYVWSPGCEPAWMEELPEVTAALAQP
jgi:hypothetical protein